MWVCCVTQFKDAINKLILANNEVAKYYKHCRTLFNRLVNDNLANLNDANHDHIKQQLLDQLEDLALTINTGNVVAVEINQDMEQQTPKYDPSLPMYDLPKLLHEINQLKKENEQYKEDMEKLTQQHDEVMEALATMEAVQKKLEELEAMSDAELWEMTMRRNWPPRVRNTTASSGRGFSSSSGAASSPSPRTIWVRRSSPN